MSFGLLFSFWLKKARIVQNFGLFVLGANFYYYSVLYMFLALCLAVTVNQYHISLTQNAYNEYIYTFGRGCKKRLVLRSIGPVWAFQRTLK